MDIKHKSLCLNYLFLSAIACKAYVFSHTTVHFHFLFTFPHEFHKETKYIFR